MEIIKKKVLFVCIHNSARSQMAEAFLKKYGSEYFDVESAGIEPGNLNLKVIKVLNEIGIDISNNKTKPVNDLIKQGKRFDSVITVCDAASAERCPVFPGVVKKLQWSFADPSAFAGTENEILEQTRKVRDEIETKVKHFVIESNKLNYW